jgi:hypothetical protein
MHIYMCLICININYTYLIIYIGNKFEIIFTMYIYIFSNYINNTKHTHTYMRV